jgi:hypothetical protein
MNRYERNFRVGGEAKLKYLPGEYHILKRGEYVVCAVTGRQIPLSELRYWSVERQEPYATPEAAMTRYRESHPR